MTESNSFMIILIESNSFTLQHTMYYIGPDDDQAIHQ